MLLAADIIHIGDAARLATVRMNLVIP